MSNKYTCFITYWFHVLAFWLFSSFLLGLKTCLLRINWSGFSFHPQMMFPLEASVWKITICRMVLVCRIVNWIFLLCRLMYDIMSLYRLQVNYTANSVEQTWFWWKRDDVRELGFGSFSFRWSVLGHRFRTLGHISMYFEWWANKKTKLSFPVFQQISNFD